MSPVKRVQKQPPTLPQPLSLPRPRHCLYSQAFPWVAGCWETRSFGFNLDTALEVRVAAQSTTHPIRIADVPQGLTLIQRLWRKGLNCSYTVWAVICLICAACGLLLFVQQQGEEKSTLWTVLLCTKENPVQGLGLLAMPEVGFAGPPLQQASCAL